MMKLFTAMAAGGAAVASPAPPRPPNVPAGPRRNYDPAESSLRRRRGTAGAPIIAAVAHRPTFPRCEIRPHRVATAAAYPSGDARACRETSREDSRPSARQRGRRGATGAPIGASSPNPPSFRRSAAPRGGGARASEPGHARTSRDVSRRFPTIRSPTGGPGEVDAEDEELRVIIIMNDDTGFSKV